MREPSSSMKNVSSCMLYTWVLCLFKVVCIIRWISFLICGFNNEWSLRMDESIVQLHCSDLFLFLGMDEHIGAIAFFQTFPRNGWECQCNCIFLNSSCSSNWMNILVQLHFIELPLLFKMDENIGAIAFF